MPDNAINRRRFLAPGAAGPAAVATIRLTPASAQVREAAGASGTNGQPAADPFTLGVASGDPAPDGVVLWTRLAPEPLAGGGMPDQPVPNLPEGGHRRRAPARACGRRQSLMPHSSSM